MKKYFSAFVISVVVLLMAPIAAAEAPQDTEQVSSYASARTFRLYTTPIIAGVITGFMAPVWAINTAYYDSIIQKKDMNLNSPITAVAAAAGSAGYTYLFLHVTGAKSKAKSAALGANLFVAAAAMSWIYFDPEPPLLGDQLGRDLFRIGTLALAAGILTTGAVAVGARLDEKDLE